MTILRFYSSMSGNTGGEDQLKPDLSVTFSNYGCVMSLSEVK